MSRNKTNLDKLLPAARTIEWEGIKVNISPLTVKQLPLVANSLEKVVRLRAEGMEDIEIIKNSLEELISILQVCVDRPLSELPSALMPDLAIAFLEQNLSPLIMGKWQALGQKVGAILGTGAM